ncbi:DUF3426 domain-containing protein [Geotalea sp. SG265]|uniref:DUF3426 domain-containing protein n=1 Tax=Geotalea sp. SG265 TaxID=2922867 RepID=UPI001FAEA98F|nr:DUF3426 domain-containing protein [Geotalea sp. SG265]
MILQCDQCNTKFKLDDAKIKEGGVKVRCSKCKHVFLVTKEPQEETDFDAILGGLGLDAPAPSASAPASGSPATDIAASPSQENGFSQLKQALAGAGKEEPTGDDAVDEKSFDFSDFSFNEEQQPSPEEEGEKPVKSYDLSDFNPDDAETDDTGVGGDTGAALVAGSEAQPPVQDANPFEFDFDGGGQPESPDAAGERPAGESAFNEFTFDEQPAPPQPSAGADSAASGEFDFNEFSFDGEEKEEHTAADDAGNLPAPGEELDFDTFALEPSGASSEEPVFAPPAAALPPEESPAFATPAAAVSTATESFPGMELDFAENGPADQLQQSPVSEGGEGDVPGEFSFDFGEATSDAGDASLTADPAAGTAKADIPSLDFADFTEPPPFPPAAEGVAGSPSAVEPFEKENAADLGAIDFGEVVSPGPAPEERRHSSLQDLSVVGAKKEAPLQAVPQPEFEDEYPPLSISSRRKTSSFFTFAGLGIFLLLLLLVAGAGTFILKTKPELLSKVGLGVLPPWLGIKAVDDGHISVKNPVGIFVTNRSAGELFVVTGVAMNEYRKPRASIQVRAVLYGKNGAPAKQKVAYCGNHLSKEQLESLPLEKLEAAMNNQFGDSLSNLGVQPGKEIPFVVIFSQVPQDISEFGVEAAGSTVAGQ